MTFKKNIFGFILFIFVFASQAAESIPQLPSCKNCNLILISLTSTRKRSMSYYGYNRDTTPNINKFFSNAFEFENAYAPGSLTFTDALSLFYSISPNVHGAFVRHHRLEISSKLQNYPTLTDVLDSNGYNTAAFVSDEDYDYRWGIGKAFNLYFDRSFYAENGIRFRPFSYAVGTTQLVPIANEWLEKNYKKKFFLFLQGYDMHCPYTPKGKFEELYPSPHSAAIPFSSECFMTKRGPEFVEKDGKLKQHLKSFFAFLFKKKEISYYFDEDDKKYLVSRYDAELNQSDANLQSFFDKIKELGLEKNTIVVFLSEHGDYLGENGYFMKPASNAAGNLHNANINFPLLIKYPGINKKIVQKQIIQTVDLAPSFLDLLNIAPPVHMQGKSFKKTLLTNNQFNDYAYGYSQRYEVDEKEQKQISVYQLEYVQNADWKLYSQIRYMEPFVLLPTPVFSLYNMKKDPNEKTDLASTNPGMVNKLKMILNNKNKKYSVVN
jgi:arylsulfatase